MPHIIAIGTYLPSWGCDAHRIAGDDEDAITLAVEAGRAALSEGGAVERVVLVSRDLPLLESSNAAVLLAGLGLDPELEVDERLGGAPATLDAVSSARSRTLVIGTDLDPAGAAAILTADSGLQVRTAARVARSLPVRTRNASGVLHDYGDPRLLHERGLVALAALAESRTNGPLVAVEQASLSGVTVVGGNAAVCRREPVARPRPQAKITTGPEIPISLAAYERAFEAKVRREAGRHGGSDELDFPPRYRLDEDGTLTTDCELVPLPRVGTVYTEVTVHIPVPGLRTPYSLAVVELDDVGVRALVKVTGVEAGTVRIGDRGRLTLRRVAMRSGVPDYGYSFEPFQPAPREPSPWSWGAA